MPRQRIDPSTPDAPIIGTCVTAATRDRITDLATESLGIAALDAAETEGRGPP